MTRVRSLVAVVAGVALAISGCSRAGVTGSPAPAKLTVWVDAPRVPAVKAAADAFTRDTGLAVDVQEHDVAGSATELSGFDEDSRRIPDVVLTASEWTVPLVKRNAVAPVDLGSKAGSFVDPAVKASTYAGKTYAVPAGFENVALIRNTDLVPDAPKTFDALLKAGEDLVAQNKAESVVGIGDARPAAADPYHLYPLQASFGAPLFSRMGDGQSDAPELAMNNSGGTAFAAYLDRMARSKDYDASLTAESAAAKFKAGKLPFWITGPDATGDLKKSGVKYAVEQIPSAGGQSAAPLVMAQGFVVSAHSKHPIEAQKFAVDFLGSQQTQADMAKAVGRAPAHKDALAAEPDADLAAFAKVGATGAAMPSVTATTTIWSDWATAEAKLLAGSSNDPTGDWKTMCDAAAQSLRKK